MTVSSDPENTVLRLWLLLPRVGDAFNLCHDLVFSKYGITTEQWRVLACIGSRGPLRPVDMAALLERSPNSMSMLVDRMVKAGLVRRTRDRKDRRAVFVSLTNKGKEAIEPAVPAGWEFIHKVVSTLSYDDQRALADMLETLKCEFNSYLNPEIDRAEIVKNSFTKDPNLYKRMLKNLLPPGYELKLNRGEKRKTVRRR
ncbi:MarR family winged helix-turn-helix transcriptional regulator [Chloroflexota bacterium]